jgi:hypothetical protein
MSQERLPEPAARRVLDRASTLDAAHGSSVPVDALREAARDAGISAEAFEAALAEERRGSLSTRRRARRPWALLSIFAAAVLFGGVVVQRITVRNAADAGTDQAFTLRCVDAANAVERLRTHLTKNDAIRVRLQSNTARVLRVHAPTDVMAKIAAEIAAAEDEAPTCAVPPA